jgi:hypothetical protein
MAAKCPISRADFVAKAEPLTLNINGIPMTAEVKEFSTGSFGWYLNGKTTITVDGKPVSVQIGANFTVVGSKEAASQTA